MSVITDTGLTSRAVVGRFYRRLEEHAAAAWWTQVALRFGSSQESETYRWLGMVPQVREWIGGRQVRPLRSQGLTIVNKVWEATLRIDADELRRDKSGQMLVRINDLARRVATHPNKLISDLLLAGETEAGYDGQPFFAGTHVDGEESPQSNTLSHDVGTPSAPTPSEMYDAVLAGLTQMLQLVDDQGEPLHEGARSFLVMVPLGLLPPVLTALGSREIEASSNPLVTGEAFRMRWVANPRLTWNDRFVIFRNDGPSRPFIFQEELPVQVQVLGPGSELAINENQHQYGVKAIHAAGYGFWQDACLVRLV